MFTVRHAYSPNLVALANAFEDVTTAAADVD